jgi:hypothetical protein
MTFTSCNYGDGAASWWELGGKQLPR